MSRGPGNKNNLPANREQQPGYLEWLKTQRFGIYQTLSEESTKKVKSVAENAIPDIEKYLRQSRGSYPTAKIKPREHFGITFVEEHKVNQAIRGGLFSRGFVLGRVVEHVRHHNKVHNQRHEVPIKDFGWAGNSRTLAARLDNSPGLDEIFNMSEDIEEIIDIARGGGIEVMVPDHVALFKYGRQGDRKAMGGRQLREVEHIMQEHFDAAKLGALVLDDLIVGSYENQMSRAI